ncbi:MAG: DUF3526 domain-containing protein [Proteobacteria bacterium]|nr:DUF3526 domain-containing protein [Pseudomonadota bacterium]
MKAVLRRLHCEFRHAARSRAVVMALVLVVVAGAVAAHLGAADVADTQRDLAALDGEIDAQELKLRSVHRADADVGLIGYFLTFPTKHEPSPWAALSAGVSSAFPYSQHLRLLGLVPQLDSEATGSPGIASLGRFDLSFVIVFLVPLLIIALAHDIATRDDELGIGSLVAAQPLSTFQLVVERLFAVGILLAGVIGLLVGLAAAIAGVKFDHTLATWLGLALLYAAFWLVAVLAVVAGSKTSISALLRLIGLWITLCIVVPAVLNAIVLTFFPLPGGVLATVEQRQFMNAGWDKAKAATMEPFLARRTEYADVSIPQERFSWPWYYAMHEVGDQQVAEQIASHRAQLERRAQTLERLSALAPPIALQLAFDRLARTDMLTYLRHGDSIAAYHEELKGFFYPLIFAEAKLHSLRFTDIPRHHYSPPKTGTIPGFLALSIVAATGILGLGIPWFRRRLNRSSIHHDD